MLEVGLPRGLLARVSLLSMGLVYRPEHEWSLAEQQGLVCVGPASSTEEFVRLQRGLRARSGSVAPILDSAEAVAETLVRFENRSGACELLVLSNVERQKNGVLLSEACYVSDEKRLSEWALDTCKMSVSQVVRSTWPVFATWSTQSSDVGLRKRGSARPEQWELERHNTSEVAGITTPYKPYTSAWWWAGFVIACPMLVGGGVWLVVK